MNPIVKKKSIEREKTDKLRLFKFAHGLSVFGYRSLGVRYRFLFEGFRCVSLPVLFGLSF